MGVGVGCNNPKLLLDLVLKRKIQNVIFLSVYFFLGPISLGRVNSYKPSQDL